MRIFDVSGCKATIVRPGTTLGNWVSSHKSFAACNASLYDFNTGEPVGTIFEEGKLVHNAGNGYGYGVINDKPVFGSPWTQIYQEYISGYNSPVQDGRYCPPAFRDDYVFNYPNVRIGIGEKDGKVCIVTDDNVTLKQFADHALASGFKTLVNLDGGGSRHLYYSGNTIYSSQRTPYNALVFYKDGMVASPEPSAKPVCPYPIPTRNLWWGNSGDDVKWVQYMLNYHGENVSVDGRFGYETFRAVWNFQSKWSRFPDGIVGPNTRRELQK